MSINWVMLSPSEGFVRLPGERLLYTSPPRTALTIKTPNTYPGAQPFSITSGSGCTYLTNHRIVYLPTPSTPSLQSFSSPILNLHDSRVSAPFFGPNVWSAAIQPVTGGGIPSSSTLVEVKITFKEGGAFDFHANYERIKERLQQAVEVARENGQMSGDGVEGGDGRGGGALSRINMAAVDLEELPAYEATSSTQVPATSFTPSNLPTARADTRPGHQEATSSPNEDFGRIRGNAAASPEETFSPPTEPPPGYEEAQRESVANELERVVSNFQSSSKLEDSHS